MSSIAVRKMSLLFQGHRPFTLLLFFLFVNAYLVSSHLPDGLFVAKTMGLYLAVTFGWFLVAVKFYLSENVKYYAVNYLDIAVLCLLILLPLIHLLTFDIVPLKAVLTQIALGLSYFALKLLSDRIEPQRVMRSFIHVALFILVIGIVVAFLQYFGYLPSYYPSLGITGMFFNPGPFAIFIAGFAVAVYAVILIEITTRNYFSVTLLGVLFISCLFFLIKSDSRSAWVGTGSSLAIVSLLFAKARPNARFFFILRNRIFLLSSGILSLPVAYWLYFLKEESAKGRNIIWGSAWSLIRDHWFCGIGTGNFAATFIYYQGQYLRECGTRTDAILAGDTRFAFNDLLQLAAETGLTGTVLYIVILYFLIRQLRGAWQLAVKKKWCLLAFLSFTAILVVMMVAGQTAYPLQVISIAIVFWGSIAVFSVVLSGKRNQIAVNLSGHGTAVAAAVIGLICFYCSCQQMGTYLRWEILRAETHQSAANKIQAMLAFHGVDTDALYLQELAKLYMVRAEYGQAIPFLEKAIRLSPEKELYYDLGTCYEKCHQKRKAHDAFLLVKEAIPNLVKPRYLMAMLEYNTGDKKAFLSAADAALSFEPKIVTSEVAYMRYQLRMLKDTVLKKESRNSAVVPE
jgi:O-antigen polymerase